MEDAFLKRFAELQCSYCGVEHKGQWQSEWSDEGKHHYKSITCTTCNRNERVTVNYPCSGHDAVSGKHSPLESAVKKVGTE